jgi:hypothetical protein
LGLLLNTHAFYYSTKQALYSVKNEDDAVDLKVLGGGRVDVGGGFSSIKTYD